VYVTAAVSVFGLPATHVWAEIEPSAPWVGGLTTLNVSSHVSRSLPASVIPTATPSVPGSAAPAVVAIFAAAPTATTAAGATVTPMVVAINVSVPTPSVFAGALAIIARVIGQFQRLDTTRLHLAKIGRGNRRGFRVDGEGWERVSDPFIFDEHIEGRGDQEATMAAVAAAWAAHAGASEATLKAAIHVALDALGYRRPDGSRLV